MGEAPRRIKLPARMAQTCDTLVYPNRPEDNILGAEYVRADIADEMLEALKEFVEMTEAPHDEDCNPIDGYGVDPEHLLRSAKAAIAKAEQR